MALPKWLDAQPNISYEQEKRALEDAVRWGRGLGWNKASAKGLNFDTRTSSDLVLKQNENILRFAVAQKSKSSLGQIRIQALPSFREATLAWRAKGGDWRIELAGIDIDRSWDKAAFGWLVEHMFRQ